MDNKIVVQSNNAIKTIPDTVSQTAYFPHMIMLLKIDEVIDGEFIDYSGHGRNATADTITTPNDAILMPDNDTVREYLTLAGLWETFYDAWNRPVAVKLSEIGHIYNNAFYDNDEYILLCDRNVLRTNLRAINNVFWGPIDHNAQAIIDASGVTTDLEKRLIDTHIRDLKKLNAIDENFIKFNDIDNSDVKIIYGIVGNSIDQVKYNWVQPQNTDASHRLTQETDSIRVFDNIINFDGGFYLNTHFNPFTELGSTNSFSWYSPFNISDGYDGAVGENRNEFGAIGTSGGYKGIDFKIRAGSGSHYITENTYQSPSKGVAYTETNSIGYYVVNKQANTSLMVYKDGTQIGSTTNPGASSYYDSDLPLGAVSVNGVIDSTKYSVLPCAYFHIGNEIPDAVLPYLNSYVNRFVSSKVYYFFPPEETDKQ